MHTHRDGTITLQAGCGGLYTTWDNNQWMCGHTAGSTADDIQHHVKTHTHADT